MLFQTAQNFLSSGRLSPYLQASAGSEEAALILYLDNLRISQAFYSSLSLLEVSLRNALHRALERYFSGNDWLRTEQQGFMIDQRLRRHDQKSGKTVTNNKILKIMNSDGHGLHRQVMP